MIKEIKIELTNLCYRNCIHCSSEAELSDNPFTLDKISVKRVIDEARELGAESVVFTGGEATLYNDLEEVINYAKEKEMNTKLYTMCHRTEENIKFLNKLNLIGLDEIIYSTSKELVLEKFEEMNLTEFIKKLNENTDLKIGFHHVITNKTINSIDNIFNIIENIDINKFKQISFLRYVPHGRGDLSLQPNEEEMEVFKQKIIEYRKKYPNIIRLGSPNNILGINNTPCNAASETLIIGFDGRVYPCDAMKYFDYLGLGGNIFKNSLTEIYNSKYFNSIREFKDFCSEDCINCKNYNICKGGCLAQKMIYNYNNIGEITFNWYEVNAKRTKNDFGSAEILKFNALTGLVGEAGELIDCLKKIFSHNCEEKEKAMLSLIDEIGDLSWYVAVSLGLTFDFSFDDVANEIFQTNNKVKTIDDELIKYCAKCKDPLCQFKNYKYSHKISELDEIVKMNELDIFKDWIKLENLINKIVNCNDRETIIKLSAELILFLARLSNVFLKISYEQLLRENIERLKIRYNKGFDTEIANQRIAFEEQYKSDELINSKDTSLCRRKNDGI